MESSNKEDMVLIRKQDYAYDISQERRPRLPTLLDRRKRWGTLLRGRHYQPLITEVLQHELPRYAHSTGIFPTDFSTTVRECVLILASAPAVFAEAVHGTLAQRILADLELQREYEIVQERAHVQPSIYIHLLVDERGMAPTADQYLMIRDVVLKYLSLELEDDLAWHVDNVTPPAVLASATATGYRKYLWTKRRSSSHVDTLHRFCDGITKRWLETPLLDRDKPFAIPPSECGYSIDSHVRFAQHRTRQSSNYIMNLTEDICSYLHNIGRLPQLLRMNQYVVYLIFHPHQAAIAEIFFSGLLQVWIEDGGGFNAYPAGRSVASAWRLNPAEWAHYERWVIENSRLTGNVRAQKEMLESGSFVLKEKDEELRRDALDCEEGGNGDDLKDKDYVSDDVNLSSTQLRLR